MSAGHIISAMMGAFGILFFLLLFVLLILWIILPFSIFGIKDLLREAIEEQKKTNEILKDILKAGAGLKPAPTDRPDEEKDKGL
ncbi:MAG: hypothetical protein HY026_04285 [Deltaproteobacteria bacterium]|nr:hypothetical protein [Deltaproteobacteria bacterium]